MKRTRANTVYVKRVRAGGAVDSRTIKRRALKILELLELRSAELSIVLCDDSFIRALNRDYRDLDTPTDVLSFQQDGTVGNDAASTVLGDVVISLETAARVAHERRCGLVDEATALLVHGILHLLGYNHETRRSSDEMLAQAVWLEKAVKKQKSLLTGPNNSFKKAPLSPPK